MRLVTNEVQRQYNRRAEFYINGVRETFAPAGKSHILKREADWNLIATLTNVSEQELKNLNGSESDNVKAFQQFEYPKCQSALGKIILCRLLIIKPNLPVIPSARSQA